MEPEEDLLILGGKTSDGFVIVENNVPYGSISPEAPSAPNNPLPSLLSVLGKLLIQALTKPPRPYRY